MKKRPKILTGKTLKAKTGCGNLYVTLNWDDTQFMEVKPTLGKSGGCIRSMLEFTGILLSIYLHSDVPIDEKLRVFQRHAKDINCGQHFEYEGEKYMSCLDLIAWMCIDELKEEKNKEKKS